MIFERMFDVLFNLLASIFDYLPSVSFNIDGNLFDTFLDIVEVGMYMLPTGTVSAICLIVVALGGFRIVVSVIKTIWDLLPLV